MASPVCFRWISDTFIYWVCLHLQWKSAICEYCHFTNVASWVIAGLWMNHICCLKMLMVVQLGLVGLILQQKYVDYWHCRHCWGYTAASPHKSGASAQAAATGWAGETDDSSSHNAAPGRWSGKLSMPLSVCDWEPVLCLAQPPLLHPVCCLATRRWHSKTWMVPQASATLELDI